MNTVKKLIDIIFPGHETKITKKESIQGNSIDSDGKNIIFLENELQVKNCLKWLKKIKGEKLIVALSPFAMYELDCHNVPYKIIEEFYDSKELYVLGVENYSKVEKLCGLIDSQIHKKFPEMKEQGIKPAFFNFFHLKMLYDSATIRLFQLSKLIESEKPDIVIAYKSRRFPLNPEMGVQLLFPNNHESIYSQLLESQGWRVKAIMLPKADHLEISRIENANVNVAQRLKVLILKRIQNSPLLYEFAVAFKKIGWRAVLNKLKDVTVESGDNPILLYGGGYNWDYCREDLKNAGIGPVIRVISDQHHWLDSVSTDEKKQLSAVWNELKTDDEFRGFFLWGKIDFFPLMEERLRFIVERIAPACLRSYEEAESIIKDKKIKALIASTFSSCFGHSFSQAAHNAGIPVICWQHGGYGYFSNHPIVLYNDLMSSNCLLVFGEGVARKYTKDVKRHGTKLIPIGSAQLESFRKNKILDIDKKIQREKRHVLYVTTNLYQNSLYISFPPPFSDNHFWLTQKAILDIICNHEHHRAIIKLNPTSVFIRDPPIRRYVKDKGFINCELIKDEYRFIDLIPKVDIIVIDFPSTTLLQSLTTSKPIFVYTGHLHIDKPALEMLKKRVYCYDDLRTFTRALDKFLSGKDIGKVDYNNREFLEYYGMYKLDGKAGERAAQIVKNIIKI